MRSPAQRLDWLDLFRGLAVLGMVWTHSANTFLDTSHQNSSWFREWSYYHGLIAPAFFWIAGFARAHVTTAASKPAWPAMKRLLMVLLAGYMLHVPWDRLLDAQALRAALVVDVLHCLAVSGMILLVVERCGRWREPLVALLLVVFVGLEEPAQGWRTGFTALDAYFNRSHGSLFALFPWVGFGLAGFVTRRVWNGQVNLQALVVAVVGALFAFAQPWSPWPGGLPSFFLERLGWVMMSAVVVAIMEASLSRFTGWLRLAGRESLLLYIVHLLLIHSIPLPRQPLQHLIGPTQSVGGVLAIFAGLFAGSWLLGAWNERRKRRARET
ncbi:MAG: DUF1624 domain-containing protein [Verrucomicrobiaceae bacterium]|nr:DUF1624 domain-containing protein [Verrucomicrobiaceae bacterium]